MTSVLNIIEMGGLESADSRVFRIALQTHVDMLNRDFPASACALLGDVPSMLVEHGVEDTPQIRAWMWAVQCWSAAFTGKNELLPVESFAHLILDSMDIVRIADLLRFQSLGILLGGRKFQKEVGNLDFSTPPPRHLGIPNIGRISFPSGTSRFSIEREDGEISIKAKRQKYSFGIKNGEKNNGGFLFQRSLFNKVMGHFCEIPIYDASLCQPSFQCFPQITSGSAVKQWGNDVQRAAQWLDSCNMPNARSIVRWCRAMLGLVSPNQSIGSASRKEALGLVFLPAAASVYEMAECLLHESLHQHLFRLEMAAPLFAKENDNSERYYSPWRQDSRPLIMVLHGAFVFAGVAEMYRCFLNICATNEDISIHEKNLYLRASESMQAVHILEKYAKTTSVGKLVLECVGMSASLSRKFSDLPKRVKSQIDRELKKRANVYVNHLQ